MSPLLVQEGAFTRADINAVLQGAIIQLPANQAIDPHQPARYMITKGSLEALTLGAPTVGVEDGLELQFISNTAFAHTITATGLLKVGTASVNVATFAAFAGASLNLVAWQGAWYVQGANAITFS